ncbi:MAG: hypothetical protein IKC40_04385, partial [Oscillospiraceae bacterium]|nr:hypothetical protein [Oscillospiraceae bacterium]
GGHSVIAYGIEHGEWQYGDMIYTKRLLTYDNNALGFTDKACIYFNGDFEGMYIPYLDSEAGISDLFYDPNLIPYGIGNKTIYQSTYKAGDLDKDESVNAVDAAEILTAAASEGSGSDSGLNNGKRYAADVNADGELNALDAALVLQYAAYAGAGGTLTFEEFLKTA